MVGLAICKDPAELASNANFVIARAMSKIHSLRPGQNPVTYITNSMKNFCIDQYRKTKTAKRTPPKDQEIKIVAGIEPTLEFLIDDLCKNETDKIIVSKIVFEKQPVTKISEELKMSPNAVRRRLNKLRAVLTRD